MAGLGLEGVSGGGHRGRLMGARREALNRWGGMNGCR